MFDSFTNLAITIIVPDEGPPFGFVVGKGQVIKGKKKI